MCTVTYIPVRGKHFITSNRDERHTRKAALHPAIYQAGDYKLIYPKDGDAGGSWVALHETGNVAVLLNGAFVPHLTDPPYRASRGKILLDILCSADPFKFFSYLRLEGVEPFTLVLFQNENLFECRWDAVKKHVKKLDPGISYIWSSVTLYDAATISKREQWFSSFLQANPQPTQKDIFRFHQFGGDGNVANDLMMKRSNVYATVSITSILLTADRGCVTYMDTCDQKTSEKKIELLRQAEMI